MSEEIKSNTYGGDGGNEFAQSLNLPLTQDGNTPISQEKTTNELLDEIERYEQRVQTQRPHPTQNAAKPKPQQQRPRQPVYEEQEDEPVYERESRKPKKKQSNVLVGISCAVMTAAIAVMCLTLVECKTIRKTNIPSIGGAFTVAGDTQEDTSFTAQASISPSTAIIADGTNWRLGASRVLIEDNDTRTAVTINSADSFQYDGKSLSFEKDGATYIVRAIADTYTGGVQYAEEKTSESYTSSGMRYIGNGHVLVVLGICPTSKNADTAVNSVVSSVLESAVPASDDGNITVSGVPMNISNCQVSFTNNLALVKKDGFELRFIPSTYQSDAIAFGLVGTTSSGASVSHGDYASTDGTEVYLIESGAGNVMAFTNSKEFVTSVLGLQ